MTISKTIILILTLSFISCTKPVCENESINSVEELYNSFRVTKNKIFFNNSEIQFGKEIKSKTGIDLLELNLNNKKDNTHKFYSKGAYKLNSGGDSIIVFKYGTINDSDVKTLNLVTVKDGKFADSKTILEFEDGYNYDYFVFDDLIQTIKENKESKFHFTFYETKIETGQIKQLNDNPKQALVEHRHIELSNKRVILYNNFKTKLLRLKDGKEDKLTGRIIDTFGGKGYGSYWLIELDDNTFTNFKFLCFEDKALSLEDYYYFPKDIYSLESDKFIWDDTGVGKVQKPKKEQTLFSRKVFIEIIE